MKTLLTLCVIIAGFAGLTASADAQERTTTTTTRTTSSHHHHYHHRHHHHHVNQ